jgi:hypothetical protein
MAARPPRSGEVSPEAERANITWVSEFLPIQQAGNPALIFVTILFYTSKIFTKTILLDLFKHTFKNKCWV